MLCSPCFGHGVPCPYLTLSRISTSLVVGFFRVDVGFDLVGIEVVEEDGTCVMVDGWWLMVVSL